MDAEIISWSRSPGIFAGVSLDGTVVQQDKEEKEAVRETADDERNRARNREGSARRARADIGARKIRASSPDGTRQTSLTK